MAKVKKQQYAGIVYSTDDTFAYQSEEEDSIETLAPGKQRLKVLLDKKARKGKMVTLVRNFEGKVADLETLAKMLKQKCAVGGTVKDSEIIIQGDFRTRIHEFLVSLGYNVKILG